MNNNKVLLSGFPSNTDEMLKIVDITTNNVLSKIGRIDIQNTSLPNNTWRAAYEGFLYLQPSENKAIIACRYTDEVCLFDLKTGQQKSIGGPEHFSPAFKPLKEKAMDDYSIARTGETRFAFICGAVTERYIYLLYSGKKEKEDNSRFGKDVFIYDWEGMPAKHFLLDRYASGIAISPDDKDLYIADSETGDILKSSTSTN
jgi:sugar lactone lactonase YvrE